MTVLVKPNRRKERERVIARKRTSIQEFYLAVWKACGGKCEACSAVMHEAHHITYRSQGGKDIVENGIGLCRQCHYHAHNGKVVTVPKHDGHGSTTERISGRAFVLRVLDSKVNKAVYRWEKAHEQLRKAVENEPSF